MTPAWDPDDIRDSHPEISNGMTPSSPWQMVIVLPVSPGGSIGPPGESIGRAVADGWGYSVLHGQPRSRRDAALYTVWHFPKRPLKARLQSRYVVAVVAKPIHGQVRASMMASFSSMPQTLNDAPRNRRVVGRSWKVARPPRNGRVKSHHDLGVCLYRS